MVAIDAPGCFTDSPRSYRAHPTRGERPRSRGGCPAPVRPSRLNQQLPRLAKQGKTSVTPVDAGRRTRAVAVYSHAAVATLAEELLHLETGQELALRGSCHVRALSRAYPSALVAESRLAEMSVPRSTMEDRRTLVRSFTRMCIRRVCLGIDLTIRDVSVSCVCVCRGTTRALQWCLRRGRADPRKKDVNAFSRRERKSPPGMLRDVTVLGLILGSKVPLKVSKSSPKIEPGSQRGHQTAAHRR